MLLALLAAAPASGKKGLDTDSLLSGVASSLISAPSRALHTDSQGIKVTQTTCVSKESIDALAEYFSGKFKAAGLYFPPELKKIPVQKGTIVSGLDTENLINHMAWLQPNGKYTTILLIEADVSHLDQAKGMTSEQIAPLYPGATEIMTSNLESMKTMSYQTTATPAQIKQFYKDTLSKQGYVPQPDQVWFVKGAQRISVHVSTGVTSRFVMVAVTNGIADAPFPPPPPPQVETH